jgi:hypothetical protein
MNRIPLKKRRQIQSLMACQPAVSASLQQAAIIQN